MSTATRKPQDELVRLAQAALERHSEDRSEESVAGLVDAARMLVARCETDGREMNYAEQKVAADIEATLELVEDGRQSQGRRRTDPGQIDGMPKASKPWDRRPETKTGTWINQKTGERVRCVSKGERLTDGMQPVNGVRPQDASLGAAIVAMVRQDWRNAPGEKEIYAALGGGLPAGGSTMVPEQLAAQVIDLARAKIAIARGGAIFVPMTSDHMTMARLATDPVLESKVENAAFSGTDPTFGAVGFTANTIGNVVTMSRELFDDAPNAASAVQNALAAALAVKLDDIGINGTGSAEPVGLALRSDIGSTGSVGAIAWEDLVTGVVDIQTNNGEPTGFVVSPTINGDLALLTSGDGSNAAKLWLPPPSIVAPLTPLVTATCPNTTIVVGDFTQFVYAVRTDARIEISMQAGDAFEKYQVKIRLVWRGDIGLLQPTHFHRLSGITT
jgi:HK97 family phage major capsid protein